MQTDDVRVSSVDGMQTERQSPIPKKYDSQHSWLPVDSSWSISPGLRLAAGHDKPGMAETYGCPIKNSAKKASELGLWAYYRTFALYNNNNNRYVFFND